MIFPAAVHGKLDESTAPVALPTVVAVCNVPTGTDSFTFPRSFPLMHDLPCQKEPQTVSAVTEPAPVVVRNVSITTAVVLELCCGSAGYSAALHKLGCDALGVDFLRNPSKPKAAILLADLSCTAGQTLVTDIVESSNLQAVHAAPPCGTASRAREKPIPSRLLAQGAPAPRQLRSDSQPLGLPNLTPNERLRVETANAIYRFVGILFLRLHLLGIIWTLENPLTSYFWLIPEIRILLAQKGVFLVIFQQCCHGGDRPVWRQWATNLKALLSLSAVCDGTHPHAAFTISKSVSGSWTFDTAQEASYPTLLCTRAATIVVDELCLNRGFVALPTSLAMADAHPESKRQRRRASVGLFVRGNKLPQHVSEFSKTTTVDLEGLRTVGSLVTIPGFAMQAKILRLISGVSVGSSNQGLQLFAYAVGIFRSPAEFLEEAKILKHPVDMDSSVPDVLKRNAFWILTTSAVEISKFRLQRLQTLREIVDSTKEADRGVFETMSGEMQNVLIGKRLSALRLLLQHCGYPDVQVIDDIIKGLALTGTLPSSGVYPEKLRPATITVEQLRNGARWTRRGLLERVLSSGDPELDETIWKEAIEEKDKGWLDGPYSEEQLLELLKGEFVVSRRFGLRQGPKCRAIDDFSESLVNASVLTTEKIELMGVDDFVAIVKCIMEGIRPDGSVKFTLADGTVLCGRLPFGVSVEKAKAWVGKTFDLKSAYRQLATRPEEAWATVVAVFSPTDNCAKMFVQRALPFGAVGSVFGFNRASRALWAALTYWLRVVVTCFYDDFPAAEPESSCTACEIAIRSFFITLGWTLSLEEKKNKRYEPTFDMLGVVVNFGRLPEDILSIDNKPSRISEINDLIDDALMRKRCPAPLTAEIKGKSQFAANQFFGRVALGPLHQMSIHQFRCHSGIAGQAFRKALFDFKALLNSGVPRQLTFFGEQRPVLVFSDGACEGLDRNVVSVGSVFVDTADMKTWMFGAAVPDKLVEFWKSTGNVQTIGQAELLPVLLARIAFQEKMRHRRCFIFADNESARQCLIKGHSDSVASELIVRQLVALESTTQSWIWYSRVPSLSNPSDGPSRLRLVPHAENFFAQLVPTPAIPSGCFPTAF